MISAALHGMKQKLQNLICIKIATKYSDAAMQSLSPQASQQTPKPLQHSRAHPPIYTATVDSRRTQPSTHPHPSTNPSIPTPPQLTHQFAIHQQVHTLTTRPIYPSNHPPTCTLNPSHAKASVSIAIDRNLPDLGRIKFGHT